MTDLAALFPPPLLLQERAWSSAYTLISEFQSRITQGEMEQLAWIAANKPEQVTWQGIQDALRVYRQVVA